MGTWGHRELTLWLFFFFLLNMSHGTSLEAQWLRRCVSNTKGVGSIPGRGTRSYMSRCTAKKKSTPVTVLRALHVLTVTTLSNRNCHVLGAYVREG